MKLQRSLKFLCTSFFLLVFSLVLWGCSSSVGTLSFNANPTINPNLKPPTNIRTLSDVNSIAFEWNLPSQNEIAGYHLYRKKENEQSFSHIATIDSRFATHYADSKLEANTTYIYQFASFDGAKNVSPFSEAIKVKTLLIDPVAYIEAIGGYPRIVKVIWSPHQDPRVVGYLIQKKNKNGEWKDLEKINNRLLVEYIDKNLEDDSTSEYQILAFNANGTYSAPTKSVIASTKPKPIPVKNLSATKNLPKSIDLKWDAHPNKEVTHYVILRSSLFGSFSRLATIDAKQTTYSDKIDKDGAEYSYKVIAVDKDGIESLESTPVAGATLGLPRTPLVVYAQIEGDVAVLRWNPQDNRAKEYVVYKRGSNFLSETLRYTEVMTPEFVDKEVKVGEKYYYSVSAIDENGLESKKSEEVTLFLPAPK
ncbi:hypothetical protein B6S12_02600 [Helicobacter valdiviensis]|uniref:Fibronectin type-III domain-containing protein n=1 Tax=Helicobacter valdiviensis TaxID=1458358 RepID=A0A2W6NIN2_9HELI|nr:fibronectin type III domain-containing protein [Helicobacter valdiviensis]PZT48750.1 hypothetical protein B6S12_02600 [Helicobacter valdiviensis]